MNNRLRKLRTAKSITQKEVSELLDITAATYSRYEKGTLRPSIDKLIILSELYQVTLDYLLMRTEKDQIVLTNTDEHSQLLEIIYKYDSLDKRGQSSVKAILDNEYRIYTDCLNGK